MTRNPLLRSSVHAFAQSLPDDSAVFGCSIPKPQRPANEDAMVFRRVRSAREEAWVLVVADGVSTSPSGREAARSIAAALWKAGPELISAGDAEGRLRQTFHEVHAAIHARFEGRGLASVVAAVVWPQRWEVVHASVGDSLICLRDATGFRQVNEEDMVTRVRTLNSETVLVDGCPLIDRAVSQGFGVAGDIRPHIGVIRDLGWGTVIGLASDGISAVRLGSYLASVDGEPALDSVRDFCLEECQAKRDDTTLLLLRIGREEMKTALAAALADYADLPVAERERAIVHAEASRWLPTPGVLLAATCERDEARRVRLVAMLDRASPRISRADAIQLLETALLDGQGELAMRLRGLIRRLRD